MNNNACSMATVIDASCGVAHQCLSSQLKEACHGLDPSFVCLSSFVYCKSQSTPTITIGPQIQPDHPNPHQAHRLLLPGNRTTVREKLIGRGQGYLMSSQDSGSAWQRGSVALESTALLEGLRAEDECRTR